MDDVDRGEYDPMSLKAWGQGSDRNRGTNAASAFSLGRGMGHLCRSAWPTHSGCDRWSDRKTLAGLWVRRNQGRLPGEGGAGAGAV